MKQDGRRVVVKVGTSTVTRENGAPNLHTLDRLARVLADFRGMGHQVVLVSSGAIAVGTDKLKLAQRPQELERKQAAAAVGQCELMHMYDKLLGEYGCTVAQILLGAADVRDDVRREHLRNTFSALLEMGCIPVVNENESVCSTEIEMGESKLLGDNDTLSALVAQLCGADLLVLLSDIDGLYTADPRQDEGAVLIHRVDRLTERLWSMAGGAGSWRGTGGMATKLSAAQIAMSAGVDMVITNGARVETLYDIIEGKPVGTRFCAQKQV
ncbi:MAG: glutamate 5-kinase [Oscillospiraceae bacterium]|nr:glutamate 5-kinase [Oscillospiraceae bacterium]